MNSLNSKGKLYVISGPSGTGKGTICKRILEETDLQFSVSMTTRSPRPGETEGVDYYFVTNEKYDETVANGGFLEHAGIYGNRYGTPKAPVLEKMAGGIDILLDIEMQGAMQVKENYPDAVTIFILPPSLKELRKRLLGRGSETEESVEIRLRNTLDEIGQIGNYDYYVVNDDLDEAVEMVKVLIKAGHQKVDMTADEIVELFKEEN